MCFGYVDTFLFWILEEIGASKKVLGISVMLGSLFGIPFVLGSSYFIEVFGHVNTIIIGFSFYIIKAVGMYVCM